MSNIYTIYYKHMTFSEGYNYWKMSNYIWSQLMYFLRILFQCLKKCLIENNKSDSLKPF